jgi:hypothetical protein
MSYYRVIINISNIVGGCGLYLGARLRQLNVRNIYNYILYYKNEPLMVNSNLSVNTVKADNGKCV